MKTQPRSTLQGMLPRVLHPAYWDWVKRPGEMLGFWLWMGPDAMREKVARTGANATSFHTPMWIAQDDQSPLGVRTVLADAQIPSHRSAELEFEAPEGVLKVEMFISAANEGPEAEASLFADSPRSPALATASTAPRSAPNLTLQPAKPLAPGRYHVRVAVTKGVAHVWLAQKTVKDCALILDKAKLTGWAMSGKLTTPEGVEHPFIPDKQPTTPVPLGETVGDALTQLDVGAGVDIGEHNNACFVRYPDWFWSAHPNSAMRDANGQLIKLGDRLWPAMNDPVLTELGRAQMSDMARLLKDERWVRYWVLGGEQGYPDYFGRPMGDFRPVARRHYRAWQLLHNLPAKPRFGEPQWNEFRESAVVDHFANYTAHLRSLDSTRPILIPTHGNPFALDLRPKLGYPVGDLAGAADGFEAGPIAIDDDAERLIRMTLDQQGSFGVPVSAPRLADKRLDPTATGGGRSFGPASLRRFLYEALGLGVWHLGLVQWSGTLADGEWGIRGTPAEVECGKVFDEIKRAAPYLDGCSRLKPQVGLLISDATWRRRWQDRWTLLYDLAIKRGWSVTLLDDVQIGADLASEMPAVLSVDNPVVSRETYARLNAYAKAGGSVISVGELAKEDEDTKPLGALARVVTIADNASGLAVRVIHQTQTTSGANTWPVDVKPLPMDEIEAALAKTADLMQVEIVENGRRAEGIEPLLLTDGENVVAILINRTNRQRRVEVRPSHRLQSSLGRFITRNGISGAALTGKSVPETGVILDSLGTALVCIEREEKPGELIREMQRARETVSRWAELGADVSIYRGLLVRAREHVKAGRDAKACAFARTITHSLAFKASLQHREDALFVEVKAWTPEGEKATGASVRMRFVPGPFTWRPLRETSPGVFSLNLPEESLPRFYNPSTEHYEVARGLTQFILDATRTNLSGGLRGCEGSTLALPARLRPCTPLGPRAPDP